MTIVVDLFDYVAFCFLGFMCICLVLIYIFGLIGSVFGRFIR